MIGMPTYNAAHPPEQGPTCSACDQPATHYVGLPTPLSAFCDDHAPIEHPLVTPAQWAAMKARLQRMEEACALVTAERDALRFRAEQLEGTLMQLRAQGQQQAVRAGVQQGMVCHALGCDQRVRNLLPIRVDTGYPIVPNEIVHGTLGLCHDHYQAFRAQVDGAVQRWRFALVLGGEAAAQRALTNEGEVG